MEENLISVKNVYKSYSDKEVLKNINFKFYEGEILGILGFSGTGKSTILNLICGLLTPDKGDNI